MTHQEFVEGFNAGKYILSVNGMMATKAVEAGFLPAGYRAAQRFYVFIAVICFLSVIPIFIWYKAWVGMIVLFLGFGLPYAYRRTATEGVRDRLVKDEDFYYFAMGAGLCRIKVREEA